MNWFKCSKEAHEKCPDSHVCGDLGHAIFLEGSPCHKFNQKTEMEGAKERKLDLVAVVRCKDCKHYEAPEKGIFENCMRNGHLIPMLPDDFCSWGESMDGGETNGT